MSFDKPTRTLLSKMVIACRKELVADIREQLQRTYGLQPDGGILPLTSLTHLRTRERGAAAELREWHNHLAASEVGTIPERARKAFERMGLETAFTLLNRLAALRMCEERGLLRECVRQGAASAGFQLYWQLGGDRIGDRGVTYQAFLERLFDDMAVDLGALFDRRAPHSLVFPGERCLEAVLNRLNTPELASLWKEDETIGWIYQYFNPDDERKQMRDESSAPRNSRELAVRNQFFTPRYVVEFLTDNTLGRTWYEMRQGNTRLVEQCRYLVRRPNEIFLNANEKAPETEAPTDDLSQEELWKAPVYIPFRAVKDPRDLKILDPACGSGHFLLYAFDLLETMYEEAWEDAPTTQQQPSPETPSPPDPLSRYAGEGGKGICSPVSRSTGEAGVAGDGWGDEGVSGPGEKGICSPVSRLTGEETRPHPPPLLPWNGRRGEETGICSPVSRSTGEAGVAGDGRGDEGVAGTGDDATSLRSLYPTREDLLRAVPELILRHNLHGIDIDPRAAQIAALALWLRAQRTWHDTLKLKATDRPRITRSNIVVAEPMPGERDFLEEFTSSLRPMILGRMVKEVWEHMRLAGEAGALLRIEIEIDAIVRRAQEEYRQGKMEAHEGTFEEFELLPDNFWTSATTRVVNALRNYARRSDATSIQRRLFSDDAERGFAFIEICRSRYDVVLMNPPFGDASTRSAEQIAASISAGRNDIFAAFIIRLSDLLEPERGFLGAITSRAFVVGRDLRDFRQLLLDANRPSLCLFLDLGQGVLDGAIVETAAYTLSASSHDHLLYQDLRRPTVAAHKNVANLGSSLLPQRLDKFRRAHENQLLFALSSDAIKQLSADESLGQTLFDVTYGLITENDERFIRLRWEVSEKSICTAWQFISKGGEYSWFTSDLHLLVNRSGNGAELAAYAEGHSGNVARTRQSSKYYGAAAVTFSRRSQKGFSTRRLRSGACFSDKSAVIVPDSTSIDWLDNLPILLASEYYLKLIAAQSKFGAFEIGAIKQLPLPEPEWLAISSVARQIYRSVDEAERLIETSSYFVYFETQKDAFKSAWSLALSQVQLAIESIGHKLAEEVSVFQHQIVCEMNEDLAGISPQLSYALGLALGRWDIRYATGQRQPPELPDPFAPLPVCPPGMLQNDKGLPLTKQDQEYFELIGQWEYPLSIPWDGILVDDSGADPQHPVPHADDLVRRVREVIAIIWGDRAEAIEAEACELLEVKELREYFRKPGLFFADHLKRYSKSRRQAPIYWPLSTASGSYTLWIYYHRLNDGTLYTAVNRYLKPKIEETYDRLERLKRDYASTTGSAATRLKDQIDAAQTFWSELNELRDELLRVAGLPYTPNLNDGVLITASPLWRLFRLPKWRKDLEACWKSLEKGEYDWAHLAYTLWPERVKEKCRKDKSLAIAHDLEALYDAPPPKEGKRKKKGEGEQLGLPLGTGKQRAEEG